MNRSVLRWLLLSLILVSCTAASFAQIAVGISVRFGPPAIPVYAQPICPGPGYFWTPGYWAWNDDAGYYWVPGTWVFAPVGMYWTPGYWGWGGGLYLWHAGYWGPHVGFYGGVNYGFGYGGVGFVGGEWRGGGFYYNRSVTNVSVTNVTNVYNRTVIVNESHVSYNGGTGGIEARPTPQEEAWSNERHMEPLGVQVQQERAASQNRENFASENHGRPAFAATARPGDFSRNSVVAARAAGGEYHAPAMSPREARVNAPANRGSSNLGGSRSNDGFRSFTPPSKNNPTPEGREGNNSSVQNQNRNNENRYNGSRPTNQPGNSKPAQNAPRGNPQHSNPQPQHHSQPEHSSPPPREDHRGR